MQRLFLLLALALVEPAAAKIKVVESSSKEPPAWYIGAVQDAIITSAMSTVSVDDAKQNAVSQIRVKVVESIAQNINYSAFSKIEQKSGDENSFSDEFKQALLLNTAKLPFISGISESKISEFYWQVTQDTKSKIFSYTYSLKYPLPQDELKAFIAQFEAIDKQKVEQLERLESDYSYIADVADIGEAINECAELDTYFFDRERRAKVATVRGRYSSLYDRITSVTSDEELGRAMIVLRIGDKPISSSQKPYARYDRDAITNLSIVPCEGGFEVSYDTKYCQRDIPYVINLSIPIGGRRLSHQITFTKEHDDDPGQVKIAPQGVVTLTAQDIKEGSIGGVQIEMDIQAKGLQANESITVTTVVLTLPDLKDDIYCNKLSTRYTDKERLTSMGLCGSTIARRGGKSSATIKLLQGEIQGYYGKGNTPFKVKFSRSYRCNW